jgi:primosomal protein N' (replication factor Y)
MQSQVTYATYAIVALDQPRHHHSLGDETPGREIALPHQEDPALGLLLHYHIPGHLQGSMEIGQLVEVSVRGRPAYGVVIEFSGISPVDITHPILKVVDARPVLSPSMLSLARWISSYYRCTLWQALSPMLPPGAARRAITQIELSPPSRGGADSLLHALGRRQRQVVSLLESAPRSTLTLSKLKRRYSGAKSGLDVALRSLEREGFVTRHTELPSARSKPQQERIIRLAVPTEAAYDVMRDVSQRAPLQAATLDWLLKRVPKTNGSGNGGNGARNSNAYTGQAGGHIEPEEGWHPLRDLYLHTGATASTVAALERKGLVELSQRPIYRKPVPPTAGSSNDEPPPLTPAQAAAWREIAAAVRDQLAAPTDDGRPTTDDRRPTTDDGSEEEPKIQNPKSKIQNYLLHGVTGSGKTEIYLRAIGMALRMGRQAIVLVPEISLTPQAVHRFASRFPGRVALIHSQLSPGQQFDEWRRIRDGQADIVVGSRSAVFAPLPRLGLIVVDEEHEWAYKQQDFQPRYHARDVALKRAELQGCVAILGSATPDLATYYHAQNGEYGLLSLPTRVGRRMTKDGSHLTTELPMPQMQVVDMRAELRTGNTSLFSRALQGALDETLARREQAILYLNRRGSNSFVLCRECGHVPMCRRCDVPLVYHADVFGMLCHRCNAYSLTYHDCPSCGSAQIKGFGVGTQKVVDEVAALFPRARVLRWDRDTASRQGGHSDMMGTFVRGEADVLVGTQMIAKGLDIARVTLVGVISADTGLYMPDFRAPERSVQLLMQVAGRAGRRTETTHSKVIVQTFNPDHYAIEAASRYDYRGFYEGEIRFRAEHGYPPHGQLARLVYSSNSNERCEQISGVVARHLRRKVEHLRAERDANTGEIDILGPAPCFIHKVRGRYRWQILIRGDNISPLLDGFHPGQGWSLDVDPMSVL